MEKYILKSISSSWNSFYPAASVDKVANIRLCCKGFTFHFFPHKSLHDILIINQQGSVVQWFPCLLNGPEMGITKHFCGIINFISYYLKTPLCCLVFLLFFSLTNGNYLSEKIKFLRNNESTCMCLTGQKTVFLQIISCLYFMKTNWLAETTQNLVNTLLPFFRHAKTLSQ
jgi:hypothetical protein